MRMQRGEHLAQMLANILSQKLSIFRIYADDRQEKDKMLQPLDDTAPVPRFNVEGVVLGNVARHPPPRGQSFFSPVGPGR